MMTALAAATLAAGGALATPTPALALDNAIIGTGSTVLGIEYEHANFNGSQLILLANPTGCTVSITDVDFSSPSIGLWDNQISSFRVFGTQTACLVKHFENTSFGGASIGFSFSSPFIGGAMDERTSSLEWT
jgi:hypothetical protein